MKRSSTYIKSQLEEYLFNDETNADLTKSLNTKSSNNDNEINNEINYITSIGYKTKDAIYVFKQNDKYFLCSSNDSAKLILGEFDDIDNSMNLRNIFNNDSYEFINFKEFILDLAKEIEHIDDSIEVSNDNTSSDLTGDVNLNERINIPALLKTSWNQAHYSSSDRFYNYYLHGFRSTSSQDSIIKNSKGNEIYAYAGCTAIAIAQIAYYWVTTGINGIKYPLHFNGTDTYSYTFSSSEESDALCTSTKTVYVDAMSEHTFTNDNLIDTHINGNTISSSNAELFYSPALLIKCCGTSIRSTYGNSSTGAYPFQIVKGFCSDFNFNNDITYVNMRYHDSVYYEYWSSYVYNELANKRPVFMAGEKSTGGHAWVVDGYRVSDDMYHINWGWGSGNGYFSLTTLSTNYSYNTNKVIITNLYPQQYKLDIESGDLNSDGKIDINDKIFLNNAINEVNGLSVIPDYDLNRDGEISITEIQDILDDLSGDTSNLNKKYNISINDVMMFSNFDIENEVNYEYYNININTTTHQISIIKIVKEGSNEPISSSKTYQIPNINTILITIQALINNKSNSIQNKYNSYFNNTNNAIVDLDDFFNKINTKKSYVNLGLSVDWATLNVGANEIYEPGNYYAWGMKTVDTTNAYNWATYSYGNATGCTNIGEDISGNELYDAAYDTSNHEFQMPSEEHWQELIDNCSFQKTVINNQNVWKVTGSNGNYIYLPICGCKYDNKLNGQNSTYYWTSTNNPSNSIKAKAIYCGENSVEFISQSLNRRTGTPIRPIKIRQIDKKTNKFEFIDMGFDSGTKWANMNLGARGPIDIGNYYAWGETLTKRNYVDATYLFNNLDSNSCPYNTTLKITNDSLSISGDPLYDAATSNNNNTRIPTEADWQELLTNCTWSYANVNNFKHWVITGPNGRILYLPVYGYRTSSLITSKSTYYMTANETASQSSKCKALSVTSSAHSITSINKCQGIYIRPISDDNLNNYIDLGLPSGIKWAEFNLGATNYDDYGNYYAWGEITTKSSYTWSTYNFCNIFNPITNSDNEILTNIAKTEYDAAYVFDNSICMPTSAQFQELIDNCTWEKVLINNIYFWKAISNRNGNYILLPIGGRGYNAFSNINASFGYYLRHAFYWSSSYESPNPKNGANSKIGAKYMLIQQSNDSVNKTIASSLNRSEAMLIRPILNSN